MKSIGIGTHVFELSQVILSVFLVCSRLSKGYTTTKLVFGQLLDDQCYGVDPFSVVFDQALGVKWALP